MKKIIALSAVLLAALACRPVIAIGWGEMAFVSVLIAILIGPPVYRFLRRLEELRRHERGKEQTRRERDRNPGSKK